ncbi:hypothetical protein D9M71_188750 [compost metagenome]
MLAAAAILGGQPGLALLADEALRVDEKAVHLGALGARPLFQQIALAPQFGARRRVEVGAVADPEVEVAVFGLGHAAQAAHQEQAVDRQRRIAAAQLVAERAGQALGLGEQFVVRHEAAEPRRRVRRDVAGQQRVIDVKQQRQQAQYQALAR